VRSSHVAVTPRGGGLAIVVTMLCAIPILGMLGAMGWRPVWALMGGGAIVALVGFADDHGHVAPHWRLVGHFAGAAWVLAWIGGLPALSIFGFVLEPGWLAYGLAALYLVWVLNLTNFMDGIDGIAGIEAIAIALGLTVLGLWFANFGDLAALAAALAGAVLGFLYWNWHPARIFLGDVGSQGLGYLIGFLLLRVASEGAWAAALILPLYFLADASFTLLKRLKAGKDIMSAHADHIYQESVRRGRSHAQVATAVLIANVALVLFALGAEMGERPISLAGAALTIVVLARRLLTPPLSASQSN